MIRVTEDNENQVIIYILLHFYKFCYHKYLGKSTIKITDYIKFSPSLNHIEISSKCKIR